MFVLLECGEIELASLGVKEGRGDAEGKKKKKGWKCMTPTFRQGGVVMAVGRPVRVGTQY